MNNNLKKKSDDFPVILVSYGTTIQSRQQPKIDEAIDEGTCVFKVKGTTIQSRQQPKIDPEIYNAYIDIRTKLTYLETFVDTLEMVKESNNSMNVAQIREQACTQLKKNIQELSNNEILVQTMNDNIPQSKLAKHEQIYLQETTQLIQQAGRVKEIEIIATKLMVDNLDVWDDQIAQLVKQELARQAVPALW